MGRIARVVKSWIATRASSPGEAVISQIKAQAGEERTVELWHSPGMVSIPTPDDRIAVVGVGGGGHRIGIVTQNYRIEHDLDTGETMIYSTNAAGNTVKASVKLDASGNVDIDADGAVTATGTNMTVEGSLTVTLKTGDAAIWLPNILPVDPLTGVPHGGPTAGVVKLKGA